MSTEERAKEVREASESVQRSEATEETFIVKVHKRNGKSYYRAMPSTAVNPTQHQINARIHFGNSASKAKRQKWMNQNLGMPIAAIYVRNELKGYVFGRTEKLKKWEKILYGLD